MHENLIQPGDYVLKIDQNSWTFYRVMFLDIHGPDLSPVIYLCASLDDSDLYEYRFTEGEVLFAGSLYERGTGFYFLTERYAPEGSSLSLPAGLIYKHSLLRLPVPLMSPGPLSYQPIALWGKAGELKGIDLSPVAWKRLRTFFSRKR